MKTHFDLCSGIAGFALAAGWNGYTTIGFCEIDPFCQRVIAAHYPGVPIHDNLKTLTAETVRGWIGRFDGTHVVLNSNCSRRGGDANDEVRPGWDAADDASAIGANATTMQRRTVKRDESNGTLPLAGSEPRLDLLTAGYPCQPFSHAGKRLGAEDDRHLWPFIARLVDDLRPRWCVFENVAGHISMGLDDVLSDLEEIGYSCGATVIPAAAVGAPHRRDRIWIVAHAECDRRNGGSDSERRDGVRSKQDGEHSETVEQWRRLWFGIGESRGVAPNAADSATIESRTERPGWSVIDGGDRTQTPANSEGEHGSRQPIGDATAHTESRSTDQSRNGRETLRGLGVEDDGLSGRLAERGCDRPSRTDGDTDARGDRVRNGVDAMGRGLRGTDSTRGFLDDRWNGDPLNAFGPEWEDGVPRVIDVEPQRVAKLKALGNAIVPQVAYLVIASLEVA